MEKTSPENEMQRNFEKWKRGKMVKNTKLNRNIKMKIGIRRDWKQKDREWMEKVRKENGTDENRNR